MPRYTEKDLRRIITAHLDARATDEEKAVIGEFARKLEQNKQLAVSQILEYVFLVTGDSPPPKDSKSREQLEGILLKELGGR